MSRFTNSIAIAAVLATYAVGAASALAAPAISPPTVTQITTESARLEAFLNPNGKTSSYHFEYGPADCSSNPCTATPSPDVKIPGSLGSTEVSVDLEGLTPGTTYHFRLVAKSDATVQSADDTFRTALRPPIPEQAFASCPNGGFRVGHPSEKLPDCRAYEQASPVDKNGLDAIGQVPWVKASENGDRVSFLTTDGVPGGEGAQELPAYLSSRGPLNWLTQGLLPPATLGDQAKVIGWSPDFSHAYSVIGKLGGADMALVQRSSVDGSLRTIVPFGAGLGSASFVGTSADGTEVFFSSGFKLLPEAEADDPNVYAWDAATGQLSVAAAINDGRTPTGGAVAGFGTSDAYNRDNHAIADDGSLYFVDAAGGRLYLRRNPTAPQSALSEGKCTEAAKACTVLVSASRRSVPDPTGAQPASFMTATPDGSAAFFTSREELTEDANTAPPQGTPAIVRADTDGDPIEAGFLPAAAAGIAVDSEHVYWANPVKDTIGRATIEGEDIEEEWITGADNPQYVAVDSSHIYWTNAAEGKQAHFDEPGDGSIGRADLPSNPGDPPANVTQSLVIDLENPQGIAVGVGADSDHLYWADAGGSPGSCSENPNTGGFPCSNGGAPASDSIGRANIDGSGAFRYHIELGTHVPQALAVDASHVYFSTSEVADEPSADLWRVDLDGKRENDAAVGLGLHQGIRGVAIDAGYMYWAAEGQGTIGRIALADLTEKFQQCGTTPSCERGFVQERGKVRGAAADGSNLYWSENGEPFPNPGNDLYRFDAGTGSLTDVAPDAADPNGAEVIGVLGASDDGSYLYFVANADLDGAGPATAGNCQGSMGGFNLNYAGVCSLYLAHAGTLEFITRLNASGDEETTDAVNWMPRGGLFGQTEKASRVSPDGKTLLFRSQEKLTSYDNEGISMLYRYRVGQSGPTCISCNPIGIAPSDIAPWGVNVKALEPNRPTYVLSRVLSSDGNRVFFESTDRLVVDDTNGEHGCPEVHSGPTFHQFPSCQDIYEWEAQGTGSCEEDVQGGGCLYLLSRNSSAPSFLVDASADGDDAFFITRAQLVPQDQDLLYDIYDASADGGLASQNQGPPPVPCEGEACRAGASAPPEVPSSGTSSFSGPADPKPSRAHKHKRHKSKKAKHHKRHQRNAKTAGRTGR